MLETIAIAIRQEKNIKEMQTEKEVKWLLFADGILCIGDAKNLPESKTYLPSKKCGIVEILKMVIAWLGGQSLMTGNIIL